MVHALRTFVTHLPVHNSHAAGENDTRNLSKNCKCNRALKEIPGRLLSDRQKALNLD
jgi:hypothetical protein